MRISNKCRAGIVAVVEIAMNKDSKLVTRKTILKKVTISDSYLESILTKLKIAQILIIQVGPAGGSKLFKPASKISLFEVVYAIEPLTLMNVGIKKLKKSSIDIITNNLIKMESMYLNNVSIQDLIDFETKKISLKAFKSKLIF